MKDVKKIDIKGLKRICLIPTAAVIVIASVWGITTYKNYVLTEQSQAAAYKRVALFNQSFTQYNERMIRGHDLTARTVGFLYGENVPKPIVRQFVNNIREHSGNTASIVIADHTGQVVIPDQYAKHSIADRQYFLHHQQFVTDDLYIHEPILSRLSGKNIVSVARRINQTDGGFAGIVIVGITPDSFIPSAEASTLGQRGFMGVVGMDTKYRSYQLGNGRISTGTIKIPGLDKSHNGQTVVPASYFPDGKSRMVVWNKVPGYPLITVSGVDIEEEFASAVSEKDDNISTASYISLAFLLAAIGGTSAQLLFERRRVRDSVVHDAYRSAVEVSHDGFFVLEAIRDNDNNIIDFVCIDSNTQAATLIGRPDKSMMHMRITDIFDGDFGVRLTRGYAKLMTNNESVAKTAVHIPYDCALKNKWIDYRVVPYQNGVTITVLDVTTEKQSTENAARQKVHDAVTDLPNRLGFLNAMPEILNKAAAFKSQVALFIIDVDDFKVVNDTYGYSQGDTLLKMISERLAGIIRTDDLVCRMGADEFAMVLTGKLDPTNLSDTAARVIQKLSQPFYLDDKTIRVSASVGVSVFPDQCADTTQLLQYADLAMNSAKNGGKNAYKFFEEDLYEQADRRMSLEQDLRIALERNELFLLYQPKIDLKSQKIVGMEALIRWRSPSRGLVSPLDFISIAEKTGLILPIGNFVIEQACRQIVAWRQAGRTPLPVSVNISPKQLSKGDLVDIIKQALDKYEVPAELLQIELTESSMMDDVASSQKQMQLIKSLGVKILIDDFGTGYSSLALLKKFEVDVLKVDRSFVMDIPGDPEDCAILQAIVSMANALHMEVVAEGVETAEQVIFLQKQGCESCQGFHYSKPISAEEMANWLTPS